MQQKHWLVLHLKLGKLLLVKKKLNKKEPST
jgi:hypothetical protein